MRKNVYIGAIFIVVLLITFSATAVVGIIETNERKNDVDSIGIIYHDVENIHSFAVEEKRLNVDFKPVVHPLSNVPVADTEDDEVHPTLAKGAGQFLAGHVGKISILEQYVYLTTSSDGTSWNPEMYLDFEDVRADYPDFDHWGDTSFKGTIFADIPQNYLLEIDINDLENIEAIYWDWEDDGWSDFRPLELDCHNSQNEWEYGMMCTVATTTYGQDQGWDGEDMPHMFFRDPDDENTGYISWNLVEGCEHSSCCIDKTMDIMWGAYDYYNGTSGTWNIVVWGRDFTDPLADGATKVFAEITSSYNAEYPTIAADNDNIVIVCHSDENANSDLVCFYSSDGGENWDNTYIADSLDDEQYPDVISNGGASAGCVFTMNGDLYYASTDDGGATWGDPAKLNDGGSNVVEEYRTAFVEVGSTVWSDTRNGNEDIFYSPVGNPPSKPAKPDGPTSGATNTAHTYTTSATDPDGDQIYYVFDWGDDTESVVGPFNSGEPGSASHTWTSRGNYEIKVKARDTVGIESDWSDPLAVSMPKTKQVTFPLLQKFLEILLNAFSQM